MAVEHPALAEALGASGGDVLPGYLVEEAVLGQQGQAGETADHQRTHRQRQVPEVIGEARQRAKALGALGSQAAQGTSPSSCRRRTARSGRWRRGSRAPHSRPPPTRCSTGRRRCSGAPPWPPQGNRHQVGDQRRPQAQGQRDRQLGDQVDDPCVAVEALAEIQPGVARQHQPEPLQRRLVEAVLALQGGHQLRIDAGLAVALRFQSAMPTLPPRPSGCRRRRPAGARWPDPPARRVRPGRWRS